MVDNIFEIKDLSFSYGNNKVIDGLNLKIKEGKITTLIGANGCGKSTLFNLMTKNLKPNNGEIFLAGQSVEQMKLKDFARKAAIVHQYNTAPPDITVKNWWNLAELRITQWVCRQTPKKIGERLNLPLK